MPKAKTYSKKLPKRLLDDPETAAAALEASADPWGSLRAAASSCGLPEDWAVSLISRLQRQYAPLQTELKAVKTRDLLALVEDRAFRIVESIDDFDLAQASLRDKAIAAAIFIEKRSLLRAEPGTALNSNEREGLNTLVGMMIDEARRRRIDVDLTPREFHEMDKPPTPSARRTVSQSERKRDAAVKPHRSDQEAAFDGC